jgi:hypothetical protein
MGWYALDASGSGQELAASFCEHGNEHTGSIKCWEILEQLSDWWFLKKDSDPWS